MCKVISIVNNKGGVGKTTSTGFIAQLIACLGKKVLVVDLDQQSNLSMLLNCYVDDSDDVVNGITNASIPNIAELFKYRYRDTKDVVSLIMTTPVENLYIIPSSKRHKNTVLNITANTTGNNNIILRRALAAIKDQYDYILIDNAPANDILTVNSMFASDMVLVPIRLEGFSHKGLQETLDTITYIKEEHDLEHLKFGGTFITQAEKNTVIYKDLAESYENMLESDFLKTAIRKDIKVCELESVFKPLLQYCPNSNVVYDYSKLILELNILDEAANQKLAHAINLDLANFRCTECTSSLPTVQEV